MQIERILVPTDFSPASKRAFECAVDLARELGARITLMHAYVLPMLSGLDGVLFPTAGEIARRGSAAQAELDRELRRLREPGVNVVSVLRYGAATDEIISTAEDLDADLIVMGTHGRNALPRAFLGSVADVVMRDSTRPVVVVPPGAMASYSKSATPGTTMEDNAGALG